MAWGVKYQMEITDVKGKYFTVSFFFDGWPGGIALITGSETPVTISYTGSDDDIFDPVRDSKIEINVLNNVFNTTFYNDVSTVEDKDCWVEVKDVSDNFVFSGWLIADESGRSFDTTSQAMSLTVVSPFSVMKGSELLASDGKMLFADYTLSFIINRCLSQSLPDKVAPSYSILSDLKEKDYVGSADVLQQVKSYIEAFNDDNGRPPKCYDILEKIAYSFKLRCVWENNTLKFTDPYNLDSTPKEVKIKTSLINNDFLIGNSEVVNKLKAYKEVSVRHDYSRQVGLLSNGRFLNASGGVVTDWSYYNLLNGSTVVHNINTSTVPRIGSGRKSSPYRMKFIGEISQTATTILTQTETYLQGFSATSNRLKTQDRFSVKIRFKYFDWRTKYNKTGSSNINNQVPYLYLYVFAVPPGTIGPYDLNNIVDYKNIEGTNLDSGTNTTPYWDTPSAPNGQMHPIIIAIDSVDDIQTYEFAAKWKFPDNYIFRISIFGIRWTYGRPSTTPSFDTNDLWVEIMDVILTKETGNTSYKTTGEELYLTQSGNISSIKETEDIFFANYDNVDISGALMKTNGDASGGFTRGGVTEKLQTWAVRSMMANRRTPRHKVDCEFVSNNIRPSDLIKFKDGGTDIIPNKYIIGSYRYDIKNAEMNVTAFELNTEAKPYNKASDTNQDPTGTHDILETYKIYD